MHNYLLHVGMPKTGSTALQLFLFAKSPEISYFSFATNGGTSPCQEQFEAFCHRVSTHDEIAYSFEREFDFATKNINHLNEKSRCCVVSSEGFTGRFGVNLGAKAIRLNRLFPNYKILLVIRHPIELLAAQYMQTAANLDSRRFFYALPSLQTWIEDGLAAPNHPLSPIVSIQFHKIASLYASLFGHSNVKVVAFEQFKDSPERFIEDLSVFMGIDPIDAISTFNKHNRPVNRRRPASHIVEQKMKSNFILKQLPSRMQKFLSGTYANTLGKEKYYTHLDEKTRKGVMAFSRDECLGIQNDWNIDLESYGYFR